LRTDLLDYELPEELIAVRPPKRRDGGRLLVLAPGVAVQHRVLTELPSLVPERALLIVNDTRVFRARLLGTRPGGGRVELLLTRKLSSEGPSKECWLALGKPAKRLRPGMRLELGELVAAFEERNDSGELVVTLEADGSVEAAIDRVGHVPIPPYLRREDEPDDGERYQTVFARERGSVAAPTAGLHLTPELLAALAARGVEVGKVTLHVGPGTFKPVQADDLDQHDMHSEAFELSPALAEAVARARGRGAPVVAVGTTVVRTLESAADPDRPGHVLPARRDTRLLIQPGYRFSVVDALLTNFHMPRSTLLALVAAFAGLAPTLAAYREAVAQRYRFLSYGDAMWIPKRLAS
jgi:S-adenosylmethionine:tRNA ribosyltransferase-isomerase